MLGDEQVVDVELDKSTIIKPARSNNIPLITLKNPFSLDSMQAVNQDLLKTEIVEQAGEGLFFLNCLHSYLHLG